jgi:hypothetical protein
VRPGEFSSSLEVVSGGFDVGPSRTVPGHPARPSSIA